MSRTIMNVFSVTIFSRDVKPEVAISPLEEYTLAADTADAVRDEVCVKDIMQEHKLKKRPAVLITQLNTYDGPMNFAIETPDVTLTKIVDDDFENVYESGSESSKS